MVKTSGISYIPNLQNKFGKKSERILVLPVWEIYPFWSAEGGSSQKSKHTFSKPLFITVKELPDLDKIIPDKTNVALMGMASAIGGLVSIDGAVIISAKGKIVTLSCHSSEDWGMERCEKIHVYCLNQKWKDDLVRIFAESCASGNYGYSIRGISELVTPACFGRNMLNEYDTVLFELTNTTKEKDSIIMFLNEIINFCESTY